MFSISTMCGVLEVSRAGFYAWQSRPVSERQKEEKRLLPQIKSSFDLSRQTYGYRRVYHDLRDQGIVCGKQKIAKLMRKNGLYAKAKKRFRVTTQSKHNKPIHANHLARQFHADLPNERWVSDITYIPTMAGWLYLAVVMDLYSRKIVGWAMSDRLQDSLVLEALKMALFRRKIKHGGLLVHSDRGSQYASGDCQKLLEKYGAVCSMSRKGDCWDNAAMESFFHSLKVELVHTARFQTREEARKSIFDYIEVFYNRQRRHSYLGYKAPEQYEKLTNVS